MKGTIYEGGIRTPGFVFSPLIQDPGTVSHQLIHVTDWLPTLYSLAGADSQEVEDLDVDGVNQVDVILNSGTAQSRRKGLVVNINRDPCDLLQASLRERRYKLVMNPMGGSNLQLIRS